MSNTFNDGYTQQIELSLAEFEQRIFDIEDGLTSLAQNEEDIIGYLKDIRCSMPLGLLLRRYLCGKFSNGYDKEKNAYVFELPDNRTFTVKNYRAPDYDITKDDIKEYTEVFMYIAEKYNTVADGTYLLGINRAEAKRLLKVTTTCLRSKVFLLSFALHMNTEEVNKFLTDVLAEQTYNFRDPDEIIAYYCNSNDEVNNYIDFLRIKNHFLSLMKNIPVEKSKVESYTMYARVAMDIKVRTEDDLYSFLLSNISNFTGFSKTAYDEFMSLYSTALERSDIQLLSNDELITSYEITTEEQRLKREERINNAIGLQKITNTEQLAKRMLQCIPRATTEKVNADGKKIITNDFISIYNGEKGQKSKKTQTTTLPKEITMNLLMKDRLDDLIKQKKPVDRKDLVFLKFYILSLDIQEKGTYSSRDYLVFIDECNDMLLRCGMSKLYAANRFENLILLSLASSNPFEMFEEIIENSFFNEPSIINND